ncbi:MAG TPA: hypothetical protein VH643_28250 [Gemmataceae bacterium]|jgi:hypothetical protein
MAANDVETGIERLDADLQSLFEANTAERRRQIKAAISNLDLSEEEFFSVVPLSILRLTLALRNPDSYKSLLKTVKEEATPRLEKAKEVIEQHFTDILKHPSILHFFSLPSEGEKEGEAEDEAPTALDALNIITKVEHFPGWVGSPPAMRPASRIMFSGIDHQLLLDSTCDWDDMLYLSQTLTSMLICEMENGKSLAENHLIDLPYKDSMMTRLRSLEEDLKKLKQLAKKYGLNTKEHSDGKDEGGEE